MTETPANEVLVPPYSGENVAQDATEDLGPEFDNLVEAEEDN